MNHHHNKIPGILGKAGQLVPSFNVLKKGGGLLNLKIQLSTFLSMIIYIHILKIFTI